MYAIFQASTFLINICLISIIFCRAGKVFIGTTTVAIGVVIGGVYYANIDPKFREDVEDKLLYSSAFLNAVLGKNEPKDVPIRVPSEVRMLRFVHCIVFCTEEM